MFRQRLLFRLPRWFCLLLCLMGAAVPALAQAANTPDSLSRKDRRQAFERVWKIINEDFYDAAFNGADWKGAYNRYRPRIEAAKDDNEFYDCLSQMLAELKDSHTSFQRPPLYSGKKDRLPNIGLSVFPIAGRIVVTAVDKDSDAARAGVTAGMVVVSVDDKPAAVRSAELRELIPKVVGIATERMLTVLMSSLFFTGEASVPAVVRFETADGKPLTASLKRQPPDATPTMTARRLASGFGYIRFKPWAPPNDKRLAEELKKLLDTPGLILDLRGNRGGSFVSADYFLKPETFTGTTIWRSGKVEKGYIRKSELNYAGRLVVLVDEESGSASENFAALMQETGRGTIIGRQTCGCLTSSYTESVKGGGKLQWSRVLIRTSKDRKIEGAGVIPNQLVPLTLADVRQGRDAVLEAAEKALQ